MLPSSCSVNPQRSSCSSDWAWTWVWCSVLCFIKLCPNKFTFPFLCSYWTDGLCFKLSTGSLVDLCAITRMENHWRHVKKKKKTSTDKYLNYICTFDFAHVAECFSWDLDRSRTALWKTNPTAQYMTRALTPPIPETIVIRIMMSCLTSIPFLCVLYLMSMWFSNTEVDLHCVLHIKLWAYGCKVLSEPLWFIRWKKVVRV